MNWFTNLFGKSVSDDSGETQAANRVSTPIARPVRPGPSQALVECQQNLSVDQLKKFAPLRDIDPQIVATLAHTSLLYPKDAIIFEHDQPSDGVYYLLEGELSLHPDSENHYEVREGTTLAALPLNSGKNFGATAHALTDVTILKLSSEINLLWAKQCHEQVSCVELLDIQLPEEISNRQFFDSFTHAYRENKLRLPSLPNVALKLKQAMHKDIGIKQAVDIIHIDPPIVAKLIQVANSPLYASAIPIKNCLDAVNRIGLNATRKLVLGISLKQLFNCKNPELMKGMQQLWKDSLYVSSLSFVLALECSNIDPEDALLAGLVCDIGAIPLLHFAEQFPDKSPNLAELQSSLPYLRGPVGSLVLHTLGFSAELCNIPYLAENWLYDGGDQLTLPDIVILAKLHSYFGTRKSTGLPYINSIPAYSKINEGKLNPDFSLSILHQAQNRIHAAMQLLS